MKGVCGFRLHGADRSNVSHQDTESARVDLRRDRPAATYLIACCRLLLWLRGVDVHTAFARCSVPYCTVLCDSSLPVEDRVGLASALLDDHEVQFRSTNSPSPSHHQQPFSFSSRANDPHVVNLHFTFSSYIHDCCESVGTLPGRTQGGLSGRIRSASY